MKNNLSQNKRKAGAAQVYRNIIPDEPPQVVGNELVVVPSKVGSGIAMGRVEEEEAARSLKKKKPTPPSSKNLAAAGAQPYPDQ